MIRTRSDGPSRALARVVAVADLCDDELPQAMAEAARMARRALTARDDEYDRRVLIVGRNPAVGMEWLALRSASSNGGASCEVVYNAAQIRNTLPPVTIVVLEGAKDRPDWPEMAAEIAVLGGLADMIEPKKGSRWAT